MSYADAELFVRIGKTNRHEIGDLTLASRQMKVEAEPLAPVFARLCDACSSVVYGQEDAIQLVVCALVAGGHVLMEDVPGVGKTTLAKSIARLLGLSINRIQCTPDLLPADILGYVMYDQARGTFQIRKGPIFSEIVLVDELNRATPRTQSAFLEAMEEGVVTLEDRQCPLPEPFWVLATQNPRSFEGTYSLPESELDRFLLCIRLGYPPREDEVRMLAAGGAEACIERLRPVATTADVLRWRREGDEVHVDPAVLRYIVTLADALRHHPHVLLGPSPRGSLALLRAAKAWAFIHGRDYVVPDDVRRLAVPVWGHRIRPEGGTWDEWTDMSPAAVLEDVLSRIPAPKLGEGP
ncbi:AAA family ATPase [Alicyclobacillus vulcanalis]|uniref:AAA family ATPase n=1 Tax=Alicyclobacillus vulcanalis TaxID=252246 RepID=UPI001F3AD4B2|nr:MoxR family ATPase [Alicyclobacillus vulcanalis]